MIPSCSRTAPAARAVAAPPHLPRSPPAPRPEVELRPSASSLIGTLPAPPGAHSHTGLASREIPLPFRSPRRYCSPSFSWRRRWPEAAAAGEAASRAQWPPPLPHGRAGPGCRCAPAPQSPCSFSGEAPRRPGLCSAAGSLGARQRLPGALLHFPPFPFPPLRLPPARETRSAPRAAPAPGTSALPTALPALSRVPPHRPGAVPPPHLLPLT